MGCVVRLAKPQMNDVLGRMHLEYSFPRLQGAPFDITSRPNPSYNCIAWAAGDDRRNWWPGASIGGYYWPPELTDAETLDNFRLAYELQGYTVCGLFNFKRAVVISLSRGVSLQ
jgi:hypothetical protein